MNWLFSKINIAGGHYSLWTKAAAGNVSKNYQNNFWSQNKCLSMSVFSKQLHISEQVRQRVAAKHGAEFPFLIRERMKGMHAASHSLFVVFYSQDADKKRAKWRYLFTSESLMLSGGNGTPIFSQSSTPLGSLKVFAQLGFLCVWRMFKVLHCH